MSDGGTGGDCKLVIEQMAALWEQILHLISPLHPHFTNFSPATEWNLTLDEDLCKEMYRLHLCLLLVWPLKEDSFLTNYKYHFFFCLITRVILKGLCYFLFLL